MNNDAVQAGQAIYTKKLLSVYDIWVLGFSNHLLWKCPTRIISQQFKDLVAANHMDVGVGTGYYLKKHLPKSTKRIALVDLNENSLGTTAAAIPQFNPEIYRRNVLEPITIEGDKFDSISINYLLHCLPGNMNEKSVLFANLKPLMNQGGVIFGSTILGKGVKKNGFAAKLMAFYNQKGIFCNDNDELAALESGLNQHFSQVKIKVVGCVALFSAVNE